MPTVVFTKGRAAGSDFILFTDAAGELNLTPKLITVLCDRHFGIGAEGIIRAVRTEAHPAGADVLAVEPEAEWFFDAWRPDGSALDLCGNGIRLFAHYLRAEALVDPDQDALAIGTRVGVRDVLVGDTGYTVDLGRWQIAPEHLVSAAGIEVARPGLGIDVAGDPHVVTALAHGGELDAAELSKAPEIEPAVTGGVGAEFVVPDEQFMRSGVAHIRVRSHDRVLGEVPSSAAGAAAAALAFRHWGGAGMPHRWNVKTDGGELTVRMFPTAEGEHISLSGPATLVYRGEIELP